MENILENYLKWGEKIDFTNFEDYINRNLVVNFKIKDFYDFNYVKNTIKENIELGIKHFAKENGLFIAFFKQLFYYDENKMILYIVGNYKDLTIRYEIGKIYINFKDSKVRIKRKLLDYPKIKIEKIDNKNVVLLTNFLKYVINNSLDNKICKLETDIKNLDNMKKEYNLRKNKIKKLKIN